MAQTTVTTTYASGAIEYRCACHDLPHSDHGPAIVRPDGFKAYFKHGREGGIRFGGGYLIVRDCTGTIVPGLTMLTEEYALRYKIATTPTHKA